MIEIIEDMPEGTIGFRASGTMTREDYLEVLEPALGAALVNGGVRLLFELGNDLDHISAGAMLEDAKTGLSLEFGHHADWKRAAVVTDLDWVRGAIKVFGWMAPGKIATFSLDGIGEAKVWVASSG